MRTPLVLAVFLCAATGALASAGTPVFPGEVSEWNGYPRYDFTVDGRACTIVAPLTEAEGHPWIWRARFFGHEPQTDLSLLMRGFHLAYMDVAGLYGSPQAVAHWNAYYAFLTGEHGFAPKTVLEGMSRGGLIIYNWASANPEKVACIYADAPVCRIQSWPGGKGTSALRPEDWAACLAAYGLTEEEGAAYNQNPVDRLAPIAAAKIPLLHVCGAVDVDVPVTENTAILEERYKALGGSVTVILKEGIGHHPHSLEDPRPIVDFILEHTTGKEPWFSLRRGLSNARIRFERDKTGRVAFLGGSITEMTGWRDHVEEMLQKRFPETHFDFIRAGISSTDSTLGAFRLATDVFGQGPVDLLFVEYAVNDQHNTRRPKDRIRGIEGIIRQAHRLNPAVDILVQYCVDPDKMALFNAGRPDPVIVDHERVCTFYEIPINNLALEVTDRIGRGEFTWEAFGGLHPGPFGHEVYAASISRLLDAAWAADLAPDTTIRPHALPPVPMDRFNYEHGRYVDVGQAKSETGWTLNPAWSNGDEAAKRDRFLNIPMLEATTSGATLSLSFEGTAVGVFVLAGPDVGTLTWQVDGAPPRELDQFTQWSPRLHIPWAYMLETELDPGQHKLTLRTTDSHHVDSTGCAARIMHFLVN